MDDYSDSRWMPPSPHREAIIWTLHQGRAHIEERGHDLPPLFVYEDGHRGRSSSEGSFPGRRR